ncbi:MAG: GNAT family N-acetyltransferase [Candidatus Kariarchaeaceae archaeon]
MNKNEQLAYKVLEINIKEVTDQFWDAFFDFILKNANPNNPAPSKEWVKKNHKVEIPDLYQKRWAVYSEVNTIIGWAAVGIPIEGTLRYDDNPHIMYPVIQVDRDYSRQGIGTALLKGITDFGIANNKTVIEIETSNEDSRIFYQHFGATISLEGAYYRLNFADIDWELMETWRNEGKERSPNLRIQVFSTIPEYILEEYCLVVNEIENFGVPLGDVESRENMSPELVREAEKYRSDRNEDWITVIVFEAERITGLTDILYNKNTDYMVNQDLTGVLTQYRENGIGKWLKAEMAFYIQTHYPHIKFIETENANVNDPMRSINERMGYKFNRSNYEIKFEQEKLHKRLNAI